jgi:hypothetical protein
MVALRDRPVMSPISPIVVCGPRLRTRVEPPSSGLTMIPTQPSTMKCMQSAASPCEVGGFLILIGFLTRPVAFILAGDMAVAYFMAHAPRGFFPTLNGGQLAILFCFVFLFLVFAGAGTWSVDEHLARSRSR